MIAIRGGVADARRRQSATDRHARLAHWRVANNPVNASASRARLEARRINVDCRPRLVSTAAVRARVRSKVLRRAGSCSQSNQDHEPVRLGLNRYAGESFGLLHAPNEAATGKSDWAVGVAAQP